MALNLFWIFFKTGLFCFGGGNAMLSVFERTLVTERGYLSAVEFADMIAISQITPGPFAVNIATYTGAALGGSAIQSVFYACVATFGISLPAFIYIVLIARFFKEFGHSKVVTGVMGGIKPGVIGLILASVLLMCRLSLYNQELLLSGDILGSLNYGALLLCAAAAAVSVKTKINPVAILICSGVVGVFIF